jgi:hypothetical protein
VYQLEITPAESPFAALLKGLRLLLIGLVFGICPILVLETALFQVENLEQERLIQDQRSRHERILGRLKPLDNDPMYLFRSVLRHCHHMMRLSSERRRRAVRHLHALFPNCFDVFYFDAEKKLLTEISAKRHGKRSLELAFALLWDVRKGKKIPIEREGLLKSLFGVALVSQLTDGFMKPSSIGRRARDGYFAFWVREPDGPMSASGFMLLIHPGAIKTNMALESSIRCFNRRLKSGQVGYFDFMRSGQELYPTVFAEQSGIREALAGAVARYNIFFSSPSFHGSLRRRDSPGYLVVISPRPRFFSRMTHYGVHALSLVWLILIFTKLAEINQGLSARIPTKLSGLFLFAVGTPSLVLLIGGYYALKDHSFVQMQNLEKQIREKLIQFDDRYPTEIQKLQNRMNKYIVHARSLKTPEERLKYYPVFLREKAFDTVMVINAKGKELFTFPNYKRNMETNPEHRKKGEFALILGREILKKINKSMEIDSGTLMVEMSSGIFNALMGESGAFNFDLLCAEMGMFRTIGYAGDNSWFFFDVIYNESGYADELIIGFMSAIRYEGMFLRKYLRPLSQQPDMKWRVHAWGDYVGSRMIKGSNYRQALVLRPADQPQTQAMHYEVVANRTNQRKVVRGTGSDEIWYGMRGTNISKFTLVAAASLEPLQNQIRFLWSGLLLVAFLVFLTSGVIGKLLSEQFLKPIADLSRGIQAIEQRQFDYRVPVHSPDELGEMSALMNQVTEGMKDLEVARIVQESLFPQAPLTLNEYVIYGKSRAMSDIGGDYFDYFQIGEDHLVGLVGDVSGHGVSAALIMGMAKCAFTTDFALKRDILENMQEFNRFMLKTIKKKKMMTMFLFAVDTRRHILQYTNAGHNYPMLWSAATRQVDLLVLESFPLGTRAKSVYHLKETAWNPGDTLLLYTDGVIESPNRSDEIVNYSRAQDWFGEIAAGEPDQIVAGLFSRFDEFTQGLPANDDVSLICLKRRG